MSGLTSALLRVAAAVLMTLAVIGADAPASDKAPKSGDAKGGEKVQWLSFDAAVAMAEKENKHMIVDIYTNWCGWCKVMDRHTYGNADVAAYLTQNFVLAKVNGESAAKLTWKGKALSEREFAKAVGVNGYPSTYFMKPNAELLGGVPGYIKTPDMLIYAKYIHTKYYEKGKLQEFADSLRKLGS
jgi:thioredoxin-related protein